MTWLSKNLIDKIKEEKIAPKARWRFLAKAKLLWLLFGISIIIGGLSFGVILYFAGDNDLVTIFWAKQGFVNQLLSTLPHIWLILIVIISYLASLNFSATKTGYRLRPRNVIALSLMASLIIGATAYAFGFGAHLDTRFGQALPFYKSLGERRFEFWLQPEAGRLAGEIIIYKDNLSFQLKDPQQKTWVIYTNQETFWAPPIERGTGQLVRVIGEQTADCEFSATGIYPWQRANFGPHPGSRMMMPRHLERNFSGNRNNQ